MANGETTEGGRCTWEVMVGGRSVAGPIGFVRCGRPVRWRVTDGKTGKVVLVCSVHKGLITRRHNEWGGNPLSFVPVP